MPTFQSIPLHASVASRLLRSDSGSTTAAAAAALDESFPPNGSITQNDAHQHEPPMQHQPPKSTRPLVATVETPRALLTRDPKVLVELFAQGKVQNEQQREVLLQQLEGIRHQVALEMCHQTKTGQRLLRQQMAQTETTNQPLILGVSMSALDLKNLQDERVSFTKIPYVLSTGCRALDELIAFPDEYKFSSGNQQQALNVAAEEGLGDKTVTHSHRGGLPRGHVLSLTGKIGKTQLCLQLAAQSSIQFRQRVRYCYSTAGHAGYSLAKRFRSLAGATSTDRHVRRERMKNVEFVPIANSTQLSLALADLEAEWMMQQQQSEDTKEIAMLILDSLPLMLLDKEEQEFGFLQRWLKRMARQQAAWIVVTGTTPTSAAPLNGADIQLQLSPGTSPMIDLRLVGHVGRTVANKDHISLLNTPDYGMTTQE